MYSNFYLSEIFVFPFFVCICVLTKKFLCLRSRSEFLSWVGGLLAFNLTGQEEKKEWESPEHAAIREACEMSKVVQRMHQTLSK